MKKGNWSDRGGGDFSHGALLALVAALSLGIHLLLVLFFRDYHFSGIRTRLNLSERPSMSPMIVDRYLEDPADEAVRPEATELGPLSREQLNAQSEALSRPAPATVTVPTTPRGKIEPSVASSASLRQRAEPRQDIARITERRADDSAAVLPRREVPDIERVRNAPDILPETRMPTANRELPLPEVLRPVDSMPPVPPSRELSIEQLQELLKPRQVGDRFGGAVDERRTALRAGGGKSVEGGDPFAGMLAASDREKLERIRGEVDELKERAQYKPMDGVLDTAVTVYQQDGVSWFRLTVKPRAGRMQEVIPKDVLFLADVSGSLGEGRMKYCRQALRKSLEELNPGDRFNVVAFRDAISTCSPDWMSAAQDNVDRAIDFVSALRSQGNTDMLSSLETIFRHPRDPGRPLLAIMLTDGKPTAGMTAASSIITRFSALNDGLVTVCTYGVSTRANQFLLDLLAHANRGRYAVVESGWLNRADHSKIATGFSEFYAPLRNPIMNDVTVLFSTRAAQVEAYPQNAENLYLGTPLEIYGRCPSNSGKMVCQLRGLAKGVGYDMLVEIDLNKAEKGDDSIRTEWAKRAIYASAVDYVRTKSAAAKSKMESISRDYEIPIPYADRMK